MSPLPLAQFPDIPSFAEDMANAGKTVIVAALDGTYQKRPFGRVLELVPLAESVTKLSAVCMVCKQDAAAFSQRISREREVEVIGGPEKYVALCRACYLRFTFVFPPPFPTPSPFPCLSVSHARVCVCRCAHSPSHSITEFYPQMDGPAAAARPSSAPSTPMRPATARPSSSTASSLRRI